jgi:parallel beta helix pectate lyase-like protein
MPPNLSKRRLATALAAALVLAVGLGATASPHAARRAALACGSTITTSTTLTADITGCGGDGVRIGASHVTLNLNGHLIGSSGSGATAVVVNGGATNAIVENGRITGFNTAVLVQAAFGKVQAIRAWDNSYGVVVQSADSTVVTGNTLFDNIVDGVRVFSGQKVQITNNFLRENTDDGVFVQAAAPGATITGNKAISNGGAGIDVDGPSAHVTGNVANGNTTDGILLNDDTATVGTNTASYNTKLGIDASAGDTDTGGDKAIGNGSAHQCRNVVC